MVFTWATMTYMVGTNSYMLHAMDEIVLHDSLSNSIVFLATNIGGSLFNAIFFSCMHIVSWYELILKIDCGIHHAISWP